ncbi:hypothetical protein JOB18_037645 [Solea senegalensis]|uniref:Uncharacterized protein n=1 Tax=Solea senegalensis TaxID=28829 RepID=A0AAV6PYG0_SOLSE|nr:hypothetical protein JOB18_037645 [Solea senegalensis]
MSGAAHTVSVCDDIVLILSVSVDAVGQTVRQIDVKVSSLLLHVSLELIRFFTQILHRVHTHTDTQRDLKHLLQPSVHFDGGFNGVQTVGTSTSCPLRHVTPPPVEYISFSLIFAGKNASSANRFETEASLSPSHFQLLSRDAFTCHRKYGILFYSNYTKSCLV